MPPTNNSAIDVVGLLSYRQQMAAAIRYSFPSLKLRMYLSPSEYYIYEQKAFDYAMTKIVTLRSEGKNAKLNKVFWTIVFLYLHNIRITYICDTMRHRKNFEPARD